MSSSQDDLFLLVHSLSPVEKAYFTKNTNKGSNKDIPNYLLVFHTISEMEEYDEAILERLKLKNLSYEKNYLRNAILRSMRNYQSESSADVQVKGLILDAKFLLSRGIYLKSQQFLKKAKKIAEQHHQTLALLEINQLNRRVLALLGPKNFEKKVNILIEEQTELLNVFQEESEFSDYHYSLYSRFIKKMWITNENMHNHLMNVFPKLKMDVNMLISKKGEYHILQSKKFAAHLLNDSISFNKLCSQLITWWETNEVFKGGENYRYIVDLFNYVGSCFHIKDYSKIPVIIEKINNIKPSNKLEEQIIFQKLVHYKQVYLMNVGEFNEAKNHINQIEQEILTRNIGSTTKITLICNFSIIFFFLGDYWGCIKWINEGLQNKNVEERINIQKFLRVLKCICYSELGDIDQFDATIRSSNSFFKGVGEQKHNFEFGLIRLLKKMANSPLNQLGLMYEEIQNYIDMNNSITKKTYGIDEYKFWVESKITKKPIIELVRKQLDK